MNLSRPSEARLPRTWISLLRGRIQASLAATTGVEDAADVVSYLLAGADVVMTTSALLRHGPQHAGVLLDGVADWMQRKGFDTVDQMRGLLATPTGAGSHRPGAQQLRQCDAQGQHRAVRLVVTSGQEGVMAEESAGARSVDGEPIPAADRATIADTAGLQALIDALDGARLHGDRADGQRGRDRERPDPDPRRPAPRLG